MALPGFLITVHLQEMDRRAEATRQPMANSVSW